MGEFVGVERLAEYFDGEFESLLEIGLSVLVLLFQHAHRRLGKTNKDGIFTVWSSQWSATVKDSI